MATKIDWCDEGWPVTSGCTKIAQGCENCWACRLAATRLKHHPRYAGLAVPANFAILDSKEERLVKSLFASQFNWTGEVRLHPEALNKLDHWHKPRRVFVCPMSDLFHERVPDRFIELIWDTVFDCPQHTFIVLTKRAKRLPEFAAYMNSRRRRMDYPNLQIGISISTQKELDENIHYLLDTPAAVRFLSIEPCLEGMNLHIGDSQSDRLWRRLHGGSYQREFIHWVICGCESGPNRRPFDLDWAQGIRDQCAAAGVAFYLKQMPDEKGTVVHKPFLDGRQYVEFPGGRP